MGLAPPRSFFLVTVLLGVSVTWFRPGPRLLIGGDSGIYARIGRELAERPLATWLELTLEGQPFFEHPPLGLWVEAAAFRLFGATVPVAVGVARAWATLSLVLVGIAAWQVAARRTRMVDGLEGPSLGAFAMLGLLALPGYLYASQVAMLEGPLTAALALGAWAVASLLTSRAPEGDTFPRGATLAFSLAVTLGFWAKGPPALVLLGVVAALGALGRIPWGVAGAAALAAVGAVGLTIAAFDALRAARGLEPFFGHYLAHQVWPSLTVGRHHPEPNPFFYVGPVLAWYLPALLVTPVVVGVALARRRRPWTWRLSVELALLGGLLWGGVLLGFSAATQKYQWYIHPGAVGAAFLVGAALALIPSRFERWLSQGALALALAWPLAAFVPWPLTASEAQVWALQSTPGPPGPGRRVADCSPMEGWASEHLMGFAWRAQRVPCDGAAEWQWDGRRLEPRRAD